MRVIDRLLSSAIWCVGNTLDLVLEWLIVGFGKYVSLLLLAAAGLAGYRLVALVVGGE